MKISEKQFAAAINAISKDVTRKIVFTLYEDNALTYTEIKMVVRDFKKWGNRDSGKFAYYLRVLRDNNIIKKEHGHYYLTRIDLQLTKLCHDVQNICMEYDISDLDADGKIIKIVKRGLLQ